MYFVSIIEKKDLQINRRKEIATSQSDINEAVSSDCDCGNLMFNGPTDNENT
jgi:hypothetical protein